MRIQTQIHNRYQIFDRSGNLPFSIVFGLCRRSTEDLDPRKLIVDTRNSALHVPYALTHNLLTLYEHDDEDKPTKSVSLDGLKSFGGDSTYVTLSSPVNRKERKFQAFAVYHYRIFADSELAALLETGKRYTIRFAGEDLGIKWYAYSAEDLVQYEQSPALPAVGSSKLVISTAGGRATFKVISSLPWPPSVLVEMHIINAAGDHSNEANTPSHGLVVRLQFTNTRDQTVSLQSRGIQRFLMPWGPFQPEGPDDGSRPRAIHDLESSLLSNLQITDTGTDTVVYDPAGKVNICSLRDLKADQRPNLSDLITLAPGEPLVRTANLGKILAKLQDGLYHIRLAPRGVWWCLGSIEEIRDEGDDRVPHRLYKTAIPPLSVTTTDVVTVEVKDGRGYEVRGHDC